MLSLKSALDEGEPKSFLHSTTKQPDVEKPWRNSRSKGHGEPVNPDDSLEKKYAEWLEKTRGKNKEDQSLFGQTILEEEDDFEDGL